jgi:dienelactone hydrolase
MSLLAELKQRKVFRVAATYAVVAWLLIQVVATVGPALKLPDWTLTFTVVLAALGFPVALVLAWVFDIVRTRSGGKRVVTAPDPAAAADAGSPKPPRLIPMRWVAPLLLTVVGLAAVLTWTLRQRDAERHAREDLLPQLQQLLAKDDYAGAFDVAREIERVTPADPVLASLRSSFSAPVRLATKPAGAKVFYRPQSRGEADWQLLGVTPLVDISVPLGVGVWRLEKEGSATATLVMRNPGLQLGNNPFTGCAEKKPGMTCLESTFSKDLDFTVHLADASALPAGMVMIPDLPSLVPNVGDGGFQRMPDFFIDRFEVTNKAYKEFVDAGGYVQATLWQDLPLEDAPGTTDWRALVSRFVDMTGRPGPSTWQASSFPDGTEDLPVTGISWYEAAAYCRYRGKELPTAYHWYRAANPVLELWDALSSVVAKQSNFSGRALQPVQRMGGMGPFGTYDMAGNAREWLWTQGSSGRWNVGGSYRDPSYMYWQVETAPATDRADVNGVRCMRTAQGEPVAAELREPSVKRQVDYKALQPVGDAAFAILAQQLAYQPATVNAIVTDLKSTNPAWTRRRVELPTAYDDTTFAVDLFLPTVGKPPYSVVFYMPHAGEFLANVTLDDFDPADEFRLGYLLKAGRGIAVIAFDGSFQRRWSPERMRSSTFDDRYRTRMKHWRQELGRTIDYLATRPDVDAGKLGVYGVSFGASQMAALLAVEKRIGAAVMHGGGLDTYGTLPQGEWAFNYLPRVTQPVLLLNGRSDTFFPVEAQDCMFELLGAQPPRKKHVMFEGGHVVMPRFQVQQLTLDWFDQYLGPALPQVTTAAK